MAPRAARRRVIASCAIAAAAAAATTSCGYHVVSAARGPAGARAVRVLAVESARAVDARLASAVTEALPLELARFGVTLADGGRTRGAASLRAVLEPLAEEVAAYPRVPEGVDAPSATGRVAGAWTLLARLRVRIEDERGAPLWDGTVTAHSTLPESRSLAEREASRTRAERALATLLAERVREILVR